MSLCVMGDGKTIASGSSNGVIRIWDSVTGACKQTLKGHSGVLYNVLSHNAWCLCCSWLYIELYLSFS